MNITQDWNRAAHSKLLNVPQQESDGQILYAVDCRTKSDCREIYSLHIMHDWEANTVANVFVQDIIKFMKNLMHTNNTTTSGVDFYGLFSAVASSKNNEHAEKEGNINIAFSPGIVADRIIEDGPLEDVDKISPADKFTTDDTDEMSAYHQLDKLVAYDLAMNNGISLPPKMPFASFAIGYQFIYNIFVTLYHELMREIGESDEQGGEHLVSVNFNDLIEFHCLMKESGKIKFTMRPGLVAKRLIKDDGITEKTHGETDDVEWMSAD